MLLVAPGASVKDGILRNEELDKQINAHKDKTTLVKPVSAALQVDSSPLSHQGSPYLYRVLCI